MSEHTPKRTPEAPVTGRPISEGRPEHLGRKVRIRVAVGQRFTPEFRGFPRGQWFPGLRTPGMEPVEVGMVGTITAVEDRHGEPPYVRYTLRFEDGSTAEGVYPQNVEFV